MAGMVMNKKKYESMPNDIKKIIDDMGPKYSAQTGRSFDRDAEDGMNLLKDAGGVVRELPPQDMEEIGRRLAPLWTEWIDEMEAKGLPGKAIVADYYKILKSMGSKKPFHGYKP
jgi:TRAP-type C4-dicarboxylate transport system substrate-binding protein